MHRSKACYSITLSARSTSSAGSVVSIREADGMRVVRSNRVVTEKCGRIASSYLIRSRILSIPARAHASSLLAPGAPHSGEIDVASQQAGWDLPNRHCCKRQSR
jgi:hypothetical protein